ncbi:MAG: PAS domain-containing protein, partial [Pseudomonadota bacterium]
MDFKTLMDNIPGVFWRCSCDEHWTMRFMSAGIEPLTGYRPDELVGNRVASFASLIHPADADMVEHAVHDAINNNTSWDMEYR